MNCHCSLSVHSSFSLENNTTYISVYYIPQYIERAAIVNVFLPEYFIPVFLHVGNLVKGDIQLLAHPISIFTISVNGASSLLIQRVPVLHKHPSHLVAYEMKARMT